MGVRPLFLAAAAATLFACTGGTTTDYTGHGATDPISGGSGIVTPPPVVDAGTPDAGTPDAGNPCNTQALPLGSVTANDNCSAPGTTVTTTATIITAGCNDAKVFLGNGFNCSGVLAGPTNVFTGTCVTLPCTGPLPGTVVCTQQNSTTCNIQVCSGINCP